MGLNSRNLQPYDGLEFVLNPPGFRIRHQAASTLLGRGSSGGSGAVEVITLGSGLSMSGTVLSSTGGAGVSDGDKGDITVSGSGTTWTIDNGVVTTSKLGGDITTAGKALLDDADNTAQRSTLGLGTLAVVSPSGTPDGTKFLRDDGVWAASGGGVTSYEVKKAVLYGS